MREHTASRPFSKCSLRLASAAQRRRGEFCAPRKCVDDEGDLDERCLDEGSRERAITPLMIRSGRRPRKLLTRLKPVR
eukprot:gene11020-biopygen1104